MTLAVATVDVPAAELRAGDVLVHALGGEPQASVVRGRRFGLSLADYETILGVIDERNDILRDITPYPVRWWSKSVHRFLRDRRQWGKRLKRWHSRLLVVRPFTHAVSAPVRAMSDDAAIFELVRQAGGR